MKHLFGYIIMFFISAFLIYLGVQFLKSSWVTLLIAAAIAAVITEKNNMRDVDTFIFFKYIFKACVAVFLLSRTFDIVMAVFDVSQWIASQSAAVISQDSLNHTHKVQLTKAA